MATHSSTLAGKIPWTEEPSRLESMESERVGHFTSPHLTTDSLTLSKKIKIYHVTQDRHILLFFPTYFN